MISPPNNMLLPQVRLNNLTMIEPGLPILAWLGVSGHGSAARDTIEKALALIYGDPSRFDIALTGLQDERLIAMTKSGRCRIIGAGREQVDHRLGSILGRSWAAAVLPLLAGVALGIDPKNQDARRYLVRKDHLECAALARLYGLCEAGSTPSRSEVRFALLRAFLTARMPECEPAFTEMTMQNTSRDSIGRAVLLGAAGLQRGTLRDAEAMLLRRALGLHPEATGGINEALIRSAIGRSSPRSSRPITSLKDVRPAPALKETRHEKPELADFAATVRDLAKPLKTAPFAGRVAIAQVYDAGISRGLDFGTLEEFKSKVADACRAGLLDLERYDIAGPMDSDLRDRSRTAFGRDERHFIVNEWI